MRLADRVAVAVLVGSRSVNLTVVTPIPSGAWLCDRSLALLFRAADELSFADDAHGLLLYYTQNSGEWLIITVFIFQPAWWTRPR